MKALLPGGGVEREVVVAGDDHLVRVLLRADPSGEGLQVLSGALVGEVAAVHQDVARGNGERRTKVLVVRVANAHESNLSNVPNNLAPLHLQTSPACMHLRECPCSSPLQAARRPLS